jgi:protein-S-isoprenylcysteine O-methyltransferase Ste14
MGHVPAATARRDWGRVSAVVIFAGLAAADAYLLVTRGDFGASLPGTASRILVLAFYVLLVISYWRRKPPETSDSSPSVWAAAFAATAAPFVIPIVGGGRVDDGARATISALVLLVGSAFIVWAMANLGRNISLIPQARQVVTHGAYAWVRHPLYTAEIVNTAGVCLVLSGPWPWLVLACMIAIQYFRARREEALLTAALPDYAAYQARTPMLVPRP